MYDLLAKLMIASALIQLGLSAKDLTPSHIRSHSNQVLRIDWKPVSVFPDQAKRFR